MRHGDVEPYPDSKELLHGYAGRLVKKRDGHPKAAAPDDRGTLRRQPDRPPTEEAEAMFAESGRILKGAVPRSTHHRIPIYQFLRRPHLRGRRGCCRSSIARPGMRVQYPFEAARPTNAANADGPRLIADGGVGLVKALHLDHSTGSIWEKRPCTKS